MAIGFLTRPLIIVAPSGWAETFNFWKGPASVRAPIDLTGLSAEATLTQANVGNPTPIVLSTGLGTIAIAVNAVTITVPRTTTENWVQADYDFALRIFDPTLGVDKFVIQSNPADTRAKVIQGVTA